LAAFEKLLAILYAVGYVEHHGCHAENRGEAQCLLEVAYRKERRAGRGEVMLSL
jgi:hypothetical protein